MSAPSVGFMDTIRRFVLEDLAAGTEFTTVGDSDSLVANGLIDSLGIFKLVAFLEEAFGIRIADDEILQENFRSIEAIATFVMKKRESAGR
jgi:acyl carrier protein